MSSAIPSLTASAVLVVTMTLVPGGCISHGCRDLVRVNTAAVEAIIYNKRATTGLRPPIAFLDARSPADFAAGHIPGALSIPFENIDDRHKQLNAYKTLVLYGQDHDDWRAKGSAKRLLWLGHGEVRVLEGGLDAWTTAGNDLELGG